MRVSDATLAEVRERVLAHGRVPERAPSWPRPGRRCGCTSRAHRTTSRIPAPFPATRRASLPGWRSSRTAPGISTGWPCTPIWWTPPSATFETADLHLYKVELWAKYAGAVDYDQPLHRDYGSHSLVVPRAGARYQQLTTFVFLSDVTEEDGAARIVPYEDGKHVPYTPLYLPFGSLADAEVACTGPAGSLLVYRTDILHRGSEMTGAGRPGSHPG